jgi:hypothetical protein
MSPNKCSLERSGTGSVATREYKVNNKAHYMSGVDSRIHGVGHRGGPLVASAALQVTMVWRLVHGI